MKNNFLIKPSSIISKFNVYRVLEQFIRTINLLMFSTGTFDFNYIPVGNFVTNPVP
jgi:hypothetical protein